MIQGKSPHSHLLTGRFFKSNSETAYSRHWISESFLLVLFINSILPIDNLGQEFGIPCYIKYDPFLYRTDGTVNTSKVYSYGSHDVKKANEIRLEFLSMDTVIQLVPFACHNLRLS